MDKIKKAKILLKLAKYDNILRRYQNTADVPGVRKVLKKYMEQETIYVVINVLTLQDEFVITGRPTSVGDWLEDKRDSGILVEWEMINITSCEEEARSKGLMI